MKSGLPTIAVRDIAIQRRENDLVLGTFGRGFYVFDDYSALRSTRETQLDGEGYLFSVRDPLLYEPSYPMGLPGQAFQGDSYYRGENLPPVALFTYYLKEEITSLKAQRQTMEKAQLEKGEDTHYPSYEALAAERSEKEPQLLFTVSNAAGKVVRKITSAPQKGIQRIQWDMRYADPDPINLSSSSFYNPWSDSDKGILVAPGKYFVSLAKIVQGETIALGTPIAFTIKALENRSLPATDRMFLDEFNRKVLRLSGAIGACGQTLQEVISQLRYIDAALLKSEVAQSHPAVLLSENIATKVREISIELNGDRIASTLDMDRPPSVGGRVGMLVYMLFSSTSAPTQTNIESYAIAEEEFEPVLNQIRKLVSEDLKSLQAQLLLVGAPYTPYTLPRVPAY